MSSYRTLNALGIQPIEQNFDKLVENLGFIKLLQEMKNKYSNENYYYEINKILCEKYKFKIASHADKLYIVTMLEYNENKPYMSINEMQNKVNSFKNKYNIQTTNMTIILRHTYYDDHKKAFIDCDFELKEISIMSDYTFVL